MSYAKLKLFPAIICVVLSLSAHLSFASDITKCPDVNAMRMEGISEAKLGFYNNWHPVHTSNYDTQVTWELDISDRFVGGGQRTAAEAIEWGNEVLRMAFGEPTPEFIVCKRYDKCVARCTYKLENDVITTQTTDYF